MKQPNHAPVDAKEQENDTGRFTNGLFDWSEAMIFSLILVVVVFTFFFRLIAVDGTSMLPTLQDHDMMIVSDLGYNPERGDVIVVNKETFSIGPIVKRVIAVGGDTVDINFASGEVFVNGEVLDEPYIKEPTYTAEGTEFPLTVPEGQLFLLGDNRNGSSDSRDPRIGLVDERYVIGHVLAVIFPFSSFGVVS